MSFELKDAPQSLRVQQVSQLKVLNLNPEEECYSEEKMKIFNYKHYLNALASQLLFNPFVINLVPVFSSSLNYSILVLGLQYLTVKA